MVWRGMSAALPTVLPARAQGAAARASPGVVVLRDPGPEPAKGPGAWARAPHRHVPRARRLPRALLRSWRAASGRRTCLTAGWLALCKPACSAGLQRQVFAHVCYGAPG